MGALTWLRQRLCRLDAYGPCIRWARSYRALRVTVDLPPGTLHEWGGITLIPPLAPTEGMAYDLIIVPREVDTRSPDWVRITLYARLRRGGLLVIVG